MDAVTKDCKRFNYNHGAASVFQLVWEAGRGDFDYSQRNDIQPHLKRMHFDAACVLASPSLNHERGDGLFMDQILLKLHQVHAHVLGPFKGIKLSIKKSLDWSVFCMAKNGHVYDFKLDMPIKVLESKFAYSMCLVVECKGTN